MLHYLQSLTPDAEGLLLVLAGCVVVAIVAGLKYRFRHTWWVVAVAALVLAWCAFWMPVWLGQIQFAGTGMSRAEYVAWQPVFVAGWTLVGVLAGTVVLCAVRLLRVRQGKPF